MTFLDWLLVSVNSQPRLPSCIIYIKLRNGGFKAGFYATFEKLVDFAMYVKGRSKALSLMFISNLNQTL